MVFLTYPYFHSSLSCLQAPAMIHRGQSHRIPRKSVLKLAQAVAVCITVRISVVDSQRMECDTSIQNDAFSEHPSQGQCWVLAPLYVRKVCDRLAMLLALSVPRGAPAYQAGLQIDSPCTLPIDLCCQPETTRESLACELAMCPWESALPTPASSVMCSSIWTNHAFWKSNPSMWVILNGWHVAVLGSSDPHGS